MEGPIIKKYPAHACMECPVHYEQGGLFCRFYQPQHGVIELLPRQLKPDYCKVESVTLHGAPVGRQGGVHGRRNRWQI